MEADAALTKKTEAGGTPAKPAIPAQAGIQ
jgi:hypothetical protein